MYTLAGVRAERIIEEEGRVVVEASSTAAVGVCPACGQAAARVHSRYVRELRDLPACGRPVRVRLALRRFFCRSADCPRRTFAEQVPGPTAPGDRSGHPRAIGNGAPRARGRGTHRRPPRLGWVLSRLPSSP